MIGAAYATYASVEDTANAILAAAMADTLAVLGVVAEDVSVVASSNAAAGLATEVVYNINVNYAAAGYTSATEFLTAATSALASAIFDGSQTAAIQAQAAAFGSAEMSGATAGAISGGAVCWLWRMRGVLFLLQAANNLPRLLPSHLLWLLLSVSCLQWELFMFSTSNVENRC